jgi:SAM-dependent methyltransferase
MSRAETRTGRPRWTAKNADKHLLYQESVQDTAHEISFLTRVFKRHTGRIPLYLREDFCGTALLCSDWVRSHRERTATGLDIDTDVLAWGIAHNVEPLGERASRVRLLAQDVRIPTREKFEAICAYNYSYSVFQSRDELRRYFRAVHRSLREDGIFALDAIGGWESQQVLIEKRRCKGFTYVWEQADYDPISNHYVCHIGFEFPDGSKLRRAFSYDWRLWQLQELRELLIEAGFVEVDVYWETEDENGEGTGTFRRVTRAWNDPGWNAYLVAKKSPPLPGSPDASAKGGARADVRSHGVPRSSARTHGGRSNGTRTHHTLHSSANGERRSR